MIYIIATFAVDFEKAHFQLKNQTTHADIFVDLIFYLEPFFQPAG